ncbi:MAG: helix-turn-helix transcriptional regulator [Desulfovibrionaceae bacterium]
MEKLSTRLGQRIRKLRHSAGYTQDKTAELAEISSKYLGEIERGEVQVSAQVLEKLASVFQLSLAELVQVDTSFPDSDLKTKILALVQNASDEELRLLYRIFVAIQEEYTHCHPQSTSVFPLPNTKNSMLSP